MTEKMSDKWLGAVKLSLEANRLLYSDIDSILNEVKSYGDARVREERRDPS